MRSRIHSTVRGFIQWGNAHYVALAVVVAVVISVNYVIVALLSQLSLSTVLPGAVIVGTIVFLFLALVGRAGHIIHRRRNSASVQERWVTLVAVGLVGGALFAGLEYLDSREPVRSFVYGLSLVLVTLAVGIVVNRRRG